LILVGIYEELTARATQRRKQPNPTQLNSMTQDRVETEKFTHAHIADKFILS